MSRRRSAADGPGSLPLLPRLGECSPAPRPPYLKTSSPRLPRPSANRSAGSARPQPMAAPLPGMLPGPAGNSCGCLVTRPASCCAQRPLAGLGGAAGRDPGGSAWAGPALRNPRHRPPCGFSRTAGPASPATGCRGTPKTEPDIALSSGAVLGALAPPWPQSAGGSGGSSCTAVRRERKKPSVFAGSAEQ